MKQKETLFLFGSTLFRSLMLLLDKIFGGISKLFTEALDEVLQGGEPCPVGNLRHIEIGLFEELSCLLKSDITDEFYG